MYTGTADDIHIQTTVCPYAMTTAMTTALKRVLFVILTGVAALPLVATFTSPDLQSTGLTGTGQESEIQESEILDS